MECMLRSSLVVMAAAADDDGVATLSSSPGDNDTLSSLMGATLAASYESSSMMDDAVNNGTGMMSNVTHFGGGSGGDLESSALAESFIFYVYCVPLPIIAAFGILGNTVSIIILSRPQMRSSINCCLLALASFDLILIVTSLLLFTFPAIYRHTGYMQWYHNVHTTATPWLFPIALIGQTSSVYVTLAVTFERYIAVCLPLRARSLCTYGRARLYILTIVLFSILYNVPRFFEVTTAEYVCPDDRVEYRMAASELRQNVIYIQVYITWMYLVVMFILPFSVLAVFNFFIYVQVRKVNRERQQLSTIQKREISLAVMILIVVAVFFVCNTMALIINILEINEAPSMIDILTPISNLLITINSSANFVVYCIFGKKFQRLLLNMFCAKILSRFSSQDNNYLYEESHYHPANTTGFGQNPGSGIPLGRSASSGQRPSATTYVTYHRGSRASPPQRTVFAAARSGASSGSRHSMNNGNGSTSNTARTSLDSSAIIKSSVRRESEDCSELGSSFGQHLNVPQQQQQGLTNRFRDRKSRSITSCTSADENVDNSLLCPNPLDSSSSDILLLQRSPSSHNNADD